MDKFDITLYLSNKSNAPRNPETNITPSYQVGKCKTCKDSVVWSREKVRVHKSKCKHSTAEERALFTKTSSKRSYSEISLSEAGVSQVSHQSSSHAAKRLPSPNWVDKLLPGARDNITQKVADMFYRTAIPFAIVDSAAFKDMMAAARPAYGPLLPTSRTLSGVLLDKTFKDYEERGESLVSDCSQYSLATDGWSNIINQHLVNFILLVPGKKPFLYSSRRTTEVQSKEEIAREIIEQIVKIGDPERCVSVVTDNAPNMRVSSRSFFILGRMGNH